MINLVLLPVEDVYDTVGVNEYPFSVYAFSNVNLDQLGALLISSTPTEPSASVIRPLEEHQRPCFFVDH